MPNGACLMARETFDRATMERLSDYTHFTDEGTEAVRG